MNKKTFNILVIILCAVILFGGAYLLYQNLSAENAPSQLATQPAAPSDPDDPSREPDATDASEPELQMAPDFTVRDQDNNEVRLSDFRGKPVVLNFWASSCGPCRAEMPDFNTASQRLGDEVQFMMVNLTGRAETKEVAMDFIMEKGFSFPVFFDVSQEAAATYQVYSIPTTFFINAEGQLVTMARGAIPADVLQQGIDMITE